MSFVSTAAAAAATTITLPKRILCLHGWRTSGAILRFQTRDLPSDGLSVEYVTMDAPHPASGPPYPIVAQLFPGPYFEWWDHELSTHEYRGWSETMEAVRTHCRSHGPFHGVLGFSQGASLAAYLAAQRVSDPDDAIMPDLEFCMLFAGFVPRDPSLAAMLDSIGGGGGGIDMPCVVVYGKKDKLAAKQEILAGKFKSPIVTRFNGDHELPNRHNGADTLECVRRFLAERTRK